MDSSEQLRAENERLERLVEEKESLIQRLQARIDWLTRQKFATGKSEKLDRAQLLLELDELKGQLGAALEKSAQKVSYERQVPQPRRRQDPAEHFADLPVDETVVIEPPQVKANPELFEKIGEERTFEVDVVPPRLFKREIVRPKYRHRINRSMPPVLAGAPARAVEGGYASAGLLAWVVASKYLDHLPLYRLERMTERWGAKISRQTMADWVQIVALWMKPIYDRMREDLIKGVYVQADETPVRYLDPEQRKGKASQGYLWVVGRPDGPIVFDWRLSRQHVEATRLLEGFTGILQADGYQAYDKSTTARGRVGCLAHLRRKFYESLSSSPRIAHLVLRLIARIYQYERRYREENLRPAQRACRRQSDLAPLFQRLHRLARIGQGRVPPQSELGKACAYTLSQWPSIIALLEHGEAEIDNNLIENAIRPSALGKKNWLFIGSPQAGGASAIIYSISVTCQRFGIDPFVYIRHLLLRLPTMSNQDDLTPLLPYHWKPHT